MIKNTIKKIAHLFFLACILFSPISYAKTERHIILFVWDGLRPDSISQSMTPNLYRLSQEGTYFMDNHSSFPTFTMMNASSFATGDFAGKTGFYGNTLWNKNANGLDAAGKTVDFQQPVFTEDYQILTDLNKAEPLTEVYTLFQKAHAKGITTATVGKSGPAFFQDYHQNGIILDEKHIFPESFAKYLQNKHYSIPIGTVYSYPKFILNKNNGDPTFFYPTLMLKDGVTSDPSIAKFSPHNKSNTYLMETFINQIDPKYHPQLSVIWLRSPDTTQHIYGVGSFAYDSALKMQDKLLGQLIHHLKKNNQWKNTDLIIVSDHGHSNVSGNLDQFPLREIKNGNVGDINKRNGYSVSGDFRPADLLNRAGFEAYDGIGCLYDPVLTGIKANGTTVYPTLEDKTGKICGKPMKYTTPSYFVPKILGPKAIVVAANGGSTYFYVPSHDKALIKQLVSFIQSREEFGIIFVDKQYGQLPGVLSLKQVNLENNEHRNPDIIAGSNYNDHTQIQGLMGVEFNSSGVNRGMHGSFSPIDVHNTLIAYGPDFKKHFMDSLPSGNVDVAPTIAHLLQISLPNTDGRVLLESLVTNQASSNSHLVKMQQFEPKEIASNLIFKYPTSPDGYDVDKSKSKYTVLLQTKSINQNGQTYVYFDWGKAIRY